MAGGTNLYVPVLGSGTCWVALTEAEGNVGTDQLAMFAKCTGTPPTAAGVFEHGCMMTQTDSGSGKEAVWQNTGTSAVPVWALMPTSGTSGTEYGMVAQKTNGTTDTNVFTVATLPFAATLTGVWTIAELDGPANISLVSSTLGTIATMAKGSIGVMVGSSIANAALASGSTLTVRSSNTLNATVLMSFLA